MPSKPLLKRLWVESQTKIWAATQAGSAISLIAIDYLNHVVTSDQFNKVLSTVTVPWYIPTGIAVMGLVSYLAHGHDV